MRTHFTEYASPPGATGAPSGVSRGKFVQLWRGDDEEHIVVAPPDRAVYHANIVQRFLDERGVPGDYNAKRDVYHLRDPRWTVLGGGRYELDHDAQTLSLFGTSLGYGPFDRAGLADRLSRCATLAGYDIVVD